VSRYALGKDVAFDLDGIWEYIAHDSVDAADRWIAKLFESFETIARAPGIGHARGDLTDFPVLFWPAGRYLIIYRRSWLLCRDHGTFQSS
jgi:plasmid stabilization system protein ParE